MNGLLRHFGLCLELNFKSKQALVYGYAVPILFLVAFGSVFRGDDPPLLPEMGQLLTITILGGACFGFPTALVAERERGIWRRYRLLPVPIATLVLSALAARMVMVASSVALQVVLARVAYHTPLPAHPGFEVFAVAGVTASFLGLGLVVAALANDVPAVQAMGQCLFLPMIMIGGVGIPLEALPRWAQDVSGFMPGRYAVGLLQTGFDGRGDSGSVGFDLLALAAIGAGAGIAGAKLFRWDAGRRMGRSGFAWAAAAFAIWVTVGLAAAGSGRLPVLASATGYEGITQRQIEEITYDDLPGDEEFVSRLAPPFATADSGLGAQAEKLVEWPPGRAADPGQATRNLLSAAAIADVSADLHEGQIARLVFDTLRRRQGDDRLKRILAWVILDPDGGTVVTEAPELGLHHRIREEIVRERDVLYAKKYLGRLLGRIPN